MKTQIKTITGIIFLILTITFVSSVAIDADYITLYPGSQERVSIEIDNNEDFDIEDISVALLIDEVPFTIVGSSERNIDDINENDEERVSFIIKAFTDITPGDYNIPYIIKYKNSDNETQTFEKEGSFGIRVTAKTEIDFVVEIRGFAIVGEEGRISLELINRGLGEIKSASVQIFPNGFELLSKDKVFIGTVDADDTDLASFDVIYKSTNPTISARIEYKDFDNKDRVETVNIPFKVYTKDEAIELGLIKNSNTARNAGIVIVLLIAWFVWRGIKKKRKRDRR